MTHTAASDTSLQSRSPCANTRSTHHFTCPVNNAAGLFGYSRLTGGYEGCQAEYIRVPYADNNTLKIPAHLKDEQVLLLSDVLCTSYHACECAYQGKDDVVAVWGAGEDAHFDA